MNNPYPSDFTLNNEIDEPVSLTDYRGRRLLLVFYPGDNTPVCTRQLCDYRDGMSDFRALGVEVLGISADDSASHRKFKARHQLPFPLLSDPGLKVARAWGLKGRLGMKRAVFLIDEEQRIRYRHIESLAIFRRKREELLAAIAALDEGANG